MPWNRTGDVIVSGGADRRLLVWNWVDEASHAARGLPVASIESAIARSTTSPSPRTRARFASPTRVRRLNYSHCARMYHRPYHSETVSRSPNRRGARRRRARRARPPTARRRARGGRIASRPSHAARSRAPNRRAREQTLENSASQCRVAGRRRLDEIIDAAGRRRDERRRGRSKGSRTAHASVVRVDERGDAGSSARTRMRERSRAKPSARSSSRRFDARAD